MSPRKAAALRDVDRSLREHLIATAERMVAERGAAGLTVRAIAREAGVADGVLYNHFADKEELLAHALRAHVRAVESRLAPPPEPGAGDVAANLRAHLDHGMALHRAIIPALAGLLGRPGVLSGFAELGEPGEEWRDRLAGYLRAERDLGRLAPDARTDAAAALLVGVCHETVLTLLLQGTEPERDLDGLVAAVLHGIAPRPPEPDGP